jgi:hypothetical protein
MILSVTDGIEVAEHTEPMERAEFLREFRAAQNAKPINFMLSGTLPAFLRRQAE